MKIRLNKCTRQEKIQLLIIFCISLIIISISINNYLTLHEDDCKKICKKVDMKYVKTRYAGCLCKDKIWGKTHHVNPKGEIIK